MLDTGIDVPEVVNLVFFKMVRSKTKFWQMVGRGTRLCPDLFGLGEDKKFFYIFDYCQNLEFFSENPDATEGHVAESLRKRLFKGRLELMVELARRDDGAVGGTAVRGPAVPYQDPKTEFDVFRDARDRLHAEVSKMNLDNFVVRPKRRAVEKYRSPDAWVDLSPEGHRELADEVAGLPAELDEEPEDAKRFDLLLLNLELARLRSEPRFERLRDQVRIIAGSLEEMRAIPMIQEQMALIQDLQTDEWWEDVTVPMLEGIRRRLRLLVPLIEVRRRKPIFTDFEDQIGEGSGVILDGFGGGNQWEKFREKARVFLRAHQDHIAIQKLRRNQPLTPSDLSELERVLAESGAGGPEEIKRAKAESHGLGLFVRSLVGMDRGAAKDAFAGFLDGKPMTANQIEFVDLIINQLTEFGTMDPERLYQSPFTDLAQHGPEGLFGEAEVERLVTAIRAVQRGAEAA